MAATAPRPSDAISQERWTDSHHRLVETLRSLIRIPSINPPDPPGGELQAARWIAGALEVVGIPATVHEPVPGRGSVTARLHGDGTGGPPLLLMNHLDVVPAPPEGWTHDPFAADVEDGWIYGRGAVDMKDLVAMQLEVMRLLAEETRAAGRNPATDPVPGLTRDLLFASVADEEAGGLNGAAYLALDHPETVRAAAAINEAGGVAVDIGSRRLYPIQVGEKGISVFRLTFNGIWGHASMPRKENANLLASEAVTRLAPPWPARITEITRAMLERTIEAFEGSGDLPDEAIRLLRAATSGDERVSAVALQGICLPVYTRVLDAMLRDTLSPNILHGGVKFNIVPGTASLEVDVRRLPGSSEEELEARIRERLGPELSAVTDIEVLITSEPVVHRYDDPEGLYPILEAVIRDHDPGGVPVPAMAPFGTDAKHIVDLGTPTFGFSPLRQPPGETYIERWHGIDERVSIDGLRWGLPVLYDAVRRFCG